MAWLTVPLAPVCILDAETDIPVPPMLWYETGAGYLGAPFIVMRRIEGRVPTGAPPYHTGGWVTEIGPAERAAMWWSGRTAISPATTTARAWSM